MERIILVLTSQMPLVWHEGEAANIEDVKTLLANVQEVAKKQFEAQKASAVEEGE